MKRTRKAKIGPRISGIDLVKPLALYCPYEMESINGEKLAFNKFKEIAKKKS